MSRRLLIEQADLRLLTWTRHFLLLCLAPADAALDAPESYCQIGSYNAAFPCNSKKAGFTPCTLVGIRAGAGGIRWAMLIVYYQERMQCIRCVV